MELRLTLRPSGYGWVGALSGAHVFILPRSTGCHPGYVPLASLRTVSDIRMMAVYDVTQRETFDALPGWYSELQKQYGDYDSVVKIVVGNKIDKVLHLSLATNASTYIVHQDEERQVSFEEGATFASQMKSLFVEASAKTNKGVQEAFVQLVERVIDTSESTDSTRVSDDSAPKPKEKPSKSKSSEQPKVDLKKETGREKKRGCSCSGSVFF